MSDEKPVVFDDDNPEWTEADFARARPANELLPAAAVAALEPGKGGHLIARRDGKMSVLPQHGGAKQLGTGLMRKIKKDPGIE